MNSGILLGTNLESSAQIVSVLTFCNSAIDIENIFKVIDNYE